MSRSAGIPGRWATRWRGERRDDSLMPMESTSSTVVIAAALARGIELTGIAVMVLGGLLAIGNFLLRHDVVVMVVVSEHR